MTVTILSVAGNIVIHLVTPTINIITIEGIAEINIMIIALFLTEVPVGPLTDNKVTDQQLKPS